MLWEQSMDAFAQQRTAQRAQRLGLSQLACLGRHTLTGLLCTSGRQGRDWSADYRFFAQDQWQIEGLFTPVFNGMVSLMADEAPFVAAMDDTHLKKAGTKTPGVAYRRDPLSPAFCTNFIRAQRFLQVSGLLPSTGLGGPARAIPLSYQHVPPVPKPCPSASADERRVYRQRCRLENLSTAGVGAIRAMRRRLDESAGMLGPGPARRLVVSVDGSYTNKTILKQLPERTSLIGRIRKDAKLFYPPTPADQAARGTRRQYGLPAPTPEQLRKDDSVPWQEVSAYAAGKIHPFRVKTLAPVLWAKAGPTCPLRVVVIAPVGYRLRTTGKRLYRQPAYLICTDPDLPLQQLLQYYLWRWDIEVNHRDEKQLIGVGQAQVRSGQSVQRDPAFAVAAYAMLLLAGVQTYGCDACATSVARPKWRKDTLRHRLTTRELIQQLRHELWGHALETIKRDSSHFASASPPGTKCPEIALPLAAAVLYAASG
jgi:hypothetical protein